MRHPNVPDELSTALETVASAQGWVVAYDTHYDAANAEMSKWVGSNLHRLDFQPFPGKGITVTHLIDKYFILPRFCHWAERAVPLLPPLAKTEWKTLGELEFHQPPSSYLSKVAAYAQVAA